MAGQSRDRDAKRGRGACAGTAPAAAGGSQACAGRTLAAGAAPAGAGPAGTRLAPLYKSEDPGALTPGRTCGREKTPRRTGATAARELVLSGKTQNPLQRREARTWSAPLSSA